MTAADNDTHAYNQKL